VSGRRRQGSPEAPRLARMTADATSLAKLGVRDRLQLAIHAYGRVQLAVYAYEHGIVRPGHRTPPPGRGTE
jgi:hypothetical protein